jgi:hypothetical protein
MTLEVYMKTLGVLAVSVLGTLAISAWATSSAADLELAKLQAHAGNPVDSFLMNARGASWEALGNRSLVFQDASGSAWLIETGPCPGLPNTSVIGLTTDHKRVVSGTDVLIRPGTSGSCQVIGIRPMAKLDTKIGRPNTVLGLERSNASPKRPFLNR